MSTIFFPFLKGSGIGEKYPTILLAQDWKDNHSEDTVVLDSRREYIKGALLERRFEWTIKK